MLQMTTWSTHDNEKNEVDPIPERVSILNVIHNVNPSLQTNHLSQAHSHLALCFGVADVSNAYTLKNSIVTSITIYMNNLSSKTSNYGVTE